jgi:hypothetical protein
MLIAIAIIAVIILALIIKNNSKPKPIIEEDNYQPVYDDEDLAYLKVFYKHNEITKRQVIQVYDTYACFKVEGYNLQGHRKVLYPEKMFWKCPCSVVHFENNTGLENCISCKTKGDYKRNIAIKYQNGVTFTFYLQFK